METSEDFDNLPLEFKERIISQIDKLNNEFEKYLNKSLLLDVSNLPSGKAAGLNKLGLDGNVLSFSKDIFDNESSFVSKVESNIKNGWYTPAPGGMELENILIHEYAHYLQEHIQGNSVFEKDEINSFWDNKRKEFQRGYFGRDDKNEVSDYGNTLSVEWFAESFLSFYYNRDYYEHSKAFEAFLEDLLKNK